MESKHQARVQETLDFIEKDRIIPEDPWFYSHLVARLENESEEVKRNSLFGTRVLRLRPVLAVMVILIGIAGGIFLGRSITPPVTFPESTATVYSPGEDANTALFKEISGSLDEQVLLMK